MEVAMNSYSAIATKYDSLMHDFDYAGYFDYIKQYLAGKVKGVDLCSGSGELTVRLADIGKKVIGIDQSSDMLEVARKKARAKGLNITFIEQDVSELELPSKVEFVTVCCDGVNYIKDERALYERIYHYLKADGVLIFDYSTAYKLRNILGNNVFYEDYSDYTYLWTNELDTHSVKMDITVFNRDEATGMYSRADESHRQYIHDVDETLSILRDIGFVASVVDGESYDALGEDSRRALFVCKKEI